MIKRLRGAMSHFVIWGVALCFAVWVFFFVMLLEILLWSVCWLVVRIFLVLSVCWLVVRILCCVV